MSLWLSTIPVFQMIKLRHKEVKLLIPDHTAGIWTQTLRFQSPHPCPPWYSHGWSAHIKKSQGVWESFPLGLWRGWFLVKSHWLQRAQALVSVDLVTEVQPKLTVNIRKRKPSGESFPRHLPPTHCPPELLDFLEFLFRIQTAQQSFWDTVIFTNSCNYLSL